MARKGLFRPTHPERYKGNPTQIVWRSSYELKLMLWLDAHPAVEQWQSEEFFIPYMDKTRGHKGKLGRYFPDAWVKFKDGRQYIVEVKPKTQVQMPISKNPRDGRSQKRYLKECLVWTKNQCKWEAARQYCKERGWQFQILTEDELNIKNLRH